MFVRALYPDGKQKSITIRERCTIGRKQGNDIVFPDPVVSGAHSEIRKENGRWVYEDFSSNGSFVDGIPVHNAKREIKENSKIRIGPFTLIFPEGGTKSDDNLYKIKSHIHSRLIDIQSLKEMKIENMEENARKVKIEEAIKEIMAKTNIPAEIDRKQLLKELIDDTIGLGPLEDLLRDDDITEIMVNGANQIYIEKKGKLHLTDKRFLDEDQLKNVINRIVAPLGRRIDESMPYVDARLKDGSRVNAIIPPISLIGPVITIRKFPKKRMVEEDLINFGSISPQMMEFLKYAVHWRQNIIVSGGTGSGKTTFLNVLSSFISHDERIVTIEDSAELQLNQPHIVRLEARPPNIEGKGAITIRDLVRNALRMRPDRIIIGEVRGGEALDMLQAMNTGHDGSLTTIHANSARDSISRLSTLVLMAGTELPERAVKEQIASAINIIVQQSRFPDGSRKITNISEITGMEGNTIVTHDIFVFKHKGYDENGKVLGSFQPTGVIPIFVEKLKEQKIDFPLNIFKEGEV